MLSDIVVKSPRASRHDCLHIPQPTPIISLVWGGNRARSNRLISGSNSNVSYYPALSTSVQVDTMYSTICFSRARYQDSFVMLAAHWIRAVYDQNRAFYPYVLIRPNSIAEWNKNSPITMEKHNQNPQSLCSQLAFSLYQHWCLLHLEKSQNL